MSNIKKMDDIKTKSDRFDFIALGALRYSELHDTSELKDYIIECMTFLNVQSKDVQKVANSIYNVHFKPLVNMANITIGSSGGQIVQSINSMQLSHDVYLGIKKLNDKHFKNYQTKVSLFDQFQIDALTRLQNFIKMPNKLNGNSIQNIIDYYNNNNPTYKSTSVKSTQTSQQNPQQNKSTQTGQSNPQQSQNTQSGQSNSQQSQSTQSRQSNSQQKPNAQPTQQKQQQSQSSQDQPSTTGIGITTFLMNKLKSWTVGDKNKPQKPKNK